MVMMKMIDRLMFSISVKLISSHVSLHAKAKLSQELIYRYTIIIPLSSSNLDKSKQINKQKALENVLGQVNMPMNPSVPS